MNKVDAIVDGKQKSTIREISRNRALYTVLRGFLSRLNVFAKYHPYLIGKIDAVDTRTLTAVVVDAKTRRRIEIRYDESVEGLLTRNKDQYVEVYGKVQVDRNFNPVSIQTFNKINRVDTSDLGIAEVLPSYLELTASTEPTITVELDEDKRFYTAELESLNIFACGYTRLELKENLEERVDSCWDEFVREDCSDLTDSALSLRERLLNTFREVEE